MKLFLPSACEILVSWINLIRDTCIVVTTTKANINNNSNNNNNNCTLTSEITNVKVQ